MSPLRALAFVLLAGFSAGAALAQAQAAPAPGKSAAAPPAPKPASSRQKLKSEAKGLALATQTVEAISASQLEIAARVLTGRADCEFKQTVSVDPVPDKPGHFRVGYKKASYLMVPEETSTGAVRLQDKKAGMVWLQIPMKSMLMNSRIGQRMVDDCTQPEQRAAAEAAKAAAPAAQ